MLNFWQILVMAKQWFQNIRGTFHEFLFQKYSKDIPGILQCYENVFMRSKSFVGYPVKFLILTVSSIEMFLWNLLKSFFIENKEVRLIFREDLYQCLAAGKKIKISTIFLSLLNIIIIIINHCLPDW